ncbi:MAG: aminopeptidase [Xanthomonadales bacterium]|nr:aminopeptidase [Xanthomonadales bacterium]
MRPWHRFPRAPRPLPGHGTPRLPWRAAAVLSLLAGLAGCSTLGYYGHVAVGEARLQAARRPLARVIDDPATESRVRQRLELAMAAREFASDHLALPRNRSYASYVALDRPYVAWNVFATAEFSVDALTHCFPFAGCVAYVGYFDEARARREAARLAKKGDDTSVQGVAAFSTLGWFADPILSSMLRWGDDELAAVIFHELAHQRLYVQDDTAFNESFASFVGAEGLRQWRAARGLPPPDETRQEHDHAFTELVLDLRERLRRLYASELAPPGMRQRKQEEIAAFRERYAQLRDRDWNGDPRWDAWVAAPIDNARLLPFGLYDRWLPAFAALFDAAGADWPAFYQRARALARRPPAERDRLLAELAAGHSP